MAGALVAPGDEGRRITKGQLPAGDIGAQMHLADLEAQLLRAIEADQEGIEPVEGDVRGMLPEEGRGEACPAGDAVGLAGAGVQVQRGAVENPTPRPL